MQYRALVVFAALSVAAAGCAGGEGVEAEIETLGGAEEAMVDSNTLALPHDASPSSSRTVRPPGAWAPRRTPTAFSAAWRGCGARVGRSWS